MPISAWKRKRVIIPTAIVATLIAFALAFDWNWFREPLERYVSKKTERTISIGHLDVALGWNPVVKLQQLRVGNMQGGSRAQMIGADQVDIAIHLSSVLTDNIVIPRVRLQKPDILLERLADGRSNWTFGKPHEPSKNKVDVRELMIDQGVVEYADRVLDINVKVNAATGLPKLSDTDIHRSLTTNYSFEGNYGKVPFSGTASTADLLSLQDSGEPFAILANVMLDKTKINADGTVTNLLKPSKINVQLAVAGPNLAALHPALPVALPNTPPYSISGQFSAEGKTYHYDDFKGRIGTSDIAGDATFISQSPRPLLKAKLRSNHLDLADLGPAFGATSTKDAANPAAASDVKSTKLKPKPKKITVPGERVLPNTPFKFDRLNAMDAMVTLDAKQLRVPDQLPLENLSTGINLNAGRLELSPLKMAVASGDIVSKIIIDARESPMLLDVHLALRHAKLAQLFPTLAVMKSSTGRIGADIQLVGHGNSVAQMLGNSNGTMQLAMAGGTVSNLLMEAVGLDGGEIIKFLVRGDSTTPIRCAAASFKVDKGVANSEAIVFDTGDTRVDGAGFIDMKQEQFDILLKPKPKDKSILALRVPVRLHGTFSSPGYSVMSGELLLRGGAAIALGLLNPFAALLPLIETGPGTDSDCVEVLHATAAARNNSQARIPARQVP